MNKILHGFAHFPREKQINYPFKKKCYILSVKDQSERSTLEIIVIVLVKTEMQIITDSI